MTAAQDAERLHAHGQLMLQIAGHLDNGQTIPCVTSHHRDAWTADADPEAAEYAAAQCLACPALQACRTYVDTYPEPVGTWAGQTTADRAPRRGRPKKEKRTP